jgi:hypothetical protein
MATQMRGQMAVMKLGHFYRRARETAQATISTSLPVDLEREYPEDSALVELSYDKQGNLAHISVTSATGEGLAHVLEHTVNWASVASPINYGLPNERMILRIGVGGHGRINVGIELL